MYVQNIKFKYHVELLNPELSINPKVIHFPVIPEGEKFNYIIMIKNNTNENYVCEWLTPPLCLSGLTIMPKVFEINAGNYFSCIIEYKSAFRPYGPFSFDEIKTEITKEYSQINLSNELLEEKIKKEFDNIINFQDDKKKKTDTKKVEPKKNEIKKDKKQLEEEERKKKEDDERNAKEEEERRQRLLR